MKVEISKEQREVLGQKIALCVDFLKKQIQPHLADKDSVVVEMGEVLDLHISKEEIYLTQTKVINLGFELYSKSKIFLEKTDRKKAKKYICDVYPEMAVEFLKNWEETKRKLMIQVNEKNKKLDDISRFVDSFRL